MTDVEKLKGQRTIPLGRAPDGTGRSLATDDDGHLIVEASVSVDPGGAFEIKNAATDDRAAVKAGNTAGVADLGLVVADANTLAKLEAMRVLLDGTLDAAIVSLLVPRAAPIASLTAAAATGAGTALDVSSYGMAVINVSTLSGTATVRFEATYDDVTWFAIAARQRGTGAYMTTTNAVGVFMVECAGLLKVRPNVTAWASGTVTATITASNAPTVPTYIQSHTVDHMWGEDEPNDLVGTRVKVPVGSGALYSPSQDHSSKTVTKKNVKATPGSVLSIVCTNESATAVYFQLHNKATAPVATEVPQWWDKVPAGSANAPGRLEIGPEIFSSLEYFTTGIGWAISSTAATFTDAATASNHEEHVRFG